MWQLSVSKTQAIDNLLSLSHFQRLKVCDKRQNIHPLVDQEERAVWRQVSQLPASHASPFPLNLIAFLCCERWYSHSACCDAVWCTLCRAGASDVLERECRCTEGVVVQPRVFFYQARSKRRVASDSLLFPLGEHVQCRAHLVNFVADDLCKPSPEALDERFLLRYVTREPIASSFHSVNMFGAGRISLILLRITSASPCLKLWMSTSCCAMSRRNLT
jgi:hypothetical protein